MVPFRRSKKLVNVRLQLKLVGVFLGLACLAALAQVVILDRILGDLRIESPSGSVSTTNLLFSGLGYTLLLLVPTMGVVGVLITHRIAGPAYRFERYLEALARGEYTGPCRIREGDEFQAVCDQLNAAVDALRAQAGAHSSAAEPAPRRAA